MKKPLRKDISGAAGGGVGAAVGILVIGALHQFAHIELGPVESGAVITLAGALVSFLASWLVPLSDKEERTIADRAVSAPIKGKGSR